MHEDQIRSAARAALAEVERTAHTDAAWAALLERAGTPAPTRRRWWPVAATAAALAAVVTGGVLLLNRPDQVRTVQPVATAEPVSIPPTPPGQTLPTTSPAPTSPATTSPPPTTTPTLPIDTSPFATATAVAATPTGVLLGLPDGSWAPTAMTEPATAPAYLVGKYVVQQQADPAEVGSTSGPITVISEGGPSELRTLATTAQLLDAGWVFERPTALLHVSFQDEPDGPIHYVELMDAVDFGPPVAVVDMFGDLRSVPIVAGGIANGGVVILRRSDDGTSTLQFLSFDGREMLRRSLPPGRWRLTVDGTTAWTYARNGDATGSGDSLTWLEFDLSGLTSVDGSAAVPGLAANRPCLWTRFDGKSLQCDGDRFGIGTDAGTPQPDPPVTFVMPRRGPLPADVIPYLGGFRPWVDSGVCAPTAARSSLGRAGTPARTPFNSSLAMDTYQFIGLPDAEWGGPFALVGMLRSQRSEPASRPAPGEPWPVFFEGMSAYVDLPDGRQAYIRSWGFDQAMTLRLISALTIRPSSAAIPGFDYDPERGPSGMQLLAEAPGGPVASTDAGHRLRCLVERLPDGSDALRYDVVSVTGDPLALYFAVLDRPRPIDVGRRGDSLIVISGPIHDLAPSVDDVVEAPVDAWAALLDEPYPIW